VKPKGADYKPRESVSLFGPPTIRNQKIGLTPLVADGVREITDEWNAAHPDNKLVPLQTQAIIWTEWLRMHPRQQKTAAVKETQKATIAAALAKTRAQEWRL
jgi:hypothetical protein